MTDGRGEPGGEPDGSPRIGSSLTFRARLSIGLIAAAVLPLAGFGLVLIARETASGGGDATLGRLLLFALAAAAIIGVLIAFLLAADLTRPLRAIAGAVDRVSRGDLSTRIEVAGEDELARLAESHNRLAADLERRNHELRAILRATEAATPSLGVERLAAAAAEDARQAFGMLDAAIHLVDPREIASQEVVPGESRPIRAILRVGDENLGVLVGRLPATRRWEPADQDLLELFASGIGVAVRNAQFYARVEAQNTRLVALDAAKDDFLRGISHNLQTPLASIRAYAGQLADERADRRLEVITEQSERLSRMVRQLLMVSRLESGALRPRTEVLAPAQRLRRAWEALGAADTPFDLVDSSTGWLAVADPDQLDQVLWALLDNAVKYGRGGPISTLVAASPADRTVRIAIRDSGPGVAPDDRGRLFERFARNRADDHPEGTGLGLYVSRELCRAMDGDLVLEPDDPGRSGAAFTIVLPGEPPDEG